MPPPNVESLRTPASHFANISGFPYEPKYLEYGNLRMAYLDEKEGNGDAEPETFLCLHGQPTWSYLYRKMIPVLLNYTTNGQLGLRRVIAPDFFGFGRSDKPTEESVYTFDFHRDSLLHFIRTLDLQNITLVVQDWGGILGLTLPIAEPSRFRRLIVMNTSIPIGKSPGPGFLSWRAFSNRSPDMKIGELMGRSVPHLSKAEREAYDAPFPDIRYKAGVRRFPNLVMIVEDMAGVQVSKESLRFYQNTQQFRTEDIFMACGQKDVVLGPDVMTHLAQTWRNGCYYAEIAEAGHFVQEWGQEVATLALQVFGGSDSPLAGEAVRKIVPGPPKL